MRARGRETLSAMVSVRRLECELLPLICAFDVTLAKMNVIVVLLEIPLISLLKLDHERCKTHDNNSVRVGLWRVGGRVEQVESCKRSVQVIVACR
jgi:hypothetical protein